MPQKAVSVLRAVLSLTLLTSPGLLTSALASEVWQGLPEPVAMPTATRSGYANVNGVRLYYAVYGHGRPVLLLHGGLASSNYWGAQVRELSKHYAVIVMDSRGHGRSTRNAQTYTYELMESDVIGLLDQLKVRKVSLIGWSDGGIIGLVMAMRHPERLTRVFAFGANSDPSGVNPKLGDSVNFNRYIARTEVEYGQLSKTPRGFASFVDAIGKMWASEPHITDQLKNIRVPVTIADGQYDEAILRPHTVMMSKAIPGAKLVILPNVSHFAMLQNPAEFNAALSTFMAGR